MEKFLNETFSSEPIQGVFKVEKAEIITPKRSTGGGRKRKEEQQLMEYLI